MASDRELQDEELESLEAIYGAYSFRTLDAEQRVYELRLDVAAAETFRLRLILPSDYPSKTAPVFELDHKWQLHHPAEAAEISATLDSMFAEQVGMCIIFSWGEWLRGFLEDFAASEAAATSPDAAADADSELALALAAAELEVQAQEDSGGAPEAGDLADLASLPCPDIVHGPTITDRKSTFQGHLAEVESALEVKRVMHELMQNGKIARATHNMVAYRIETEAGTMLQDCDDDGEHGASSRMLHLLQILEATNVLVVVSRWYGGIQLGPDRFKHINNAARAVLELGGYTAKGEASGKAGKKKRGSKR